MMTDLTICAVGDVRIDYEKAKRPDPEAAFALCADVFQAADINFFNCEGVYTDRVVNVPSQHTPSSTTPENFRAMAWAGFNVCSLANNHGYDRGAEGLLDTIDLARSHDVAVSGAGRNIEEARTPAIVERKGTKVAFLSYNCVGPVEFAAQHDRPGDAPMRVSTVYQAIEYQPGTPCKILTFADPEDLAALKEDIAKAKEAADLVVVHFHWGMHHIQAMIHMYQQQLAHEAIDAGVDLVLGEHDHVVKGMEVYKGVAIFYGLGDFLVDNKGGNLAATAWRKMKAKLYDLEYDYDYPTYPFAGEARHHLIVKAQVHDGKITRVSYLPCTINKGGQTFPLKAGDPRFDEVAGYFEAISRNQGFNVRLTTDGDEILVEDAGIVSRPVGPIFTKFITTPIEFAEPAATAGAAS
jgi:poly-gamma-glutamate capsule biosynthesis protein CapA/YwtB (metallophosphatase superfamily)